jgi:adenylylsulfate kinase-like enzyme
LTTRAGGVGARQPGAVVWITGLSGAGKTTLCQAVSELVKPVLPELVVLDGDAVRAVFGGDLDHSEPSRHRQIARMRSLAGVLALQGQVVLVAALYSHPDLLAENRRLLPDYFEVYLQAPIDLLRRRDSKGLYGGAASGATTDVVGVDIPWHAPQAPDLVFEASMGLTPEAMARELAARVPRLRAALA